MKGSGLSERERRFVEAYMGVGAGNATKAAWIAGYTTKGARRTGRQHARCTAGNKRRIEEGRMQWMVAVCRVGSGFLSNPPEFLANPDSRIQPSWAYGVVRAANKDLADDACLKAWDEGRLTGQHPGDEFINYYIVPLVGRVESHDTAGTE